jgi:hypothetical protein
VRNTHESLMQPMYATCLFCNGKLGTNDELEHFPVGRSLAYDLAKGRLWVVCPSCARWNLTPLEVRWEAMEEAERAYRSASIRRTSENIGLARLRGGVNLVRIGKPPQLELAAWRYGSHLRRRRTAYYALYGLGMGAMLLPLAPALGAGTAVGLTAVAASIVHTRFDAHRSRKDRKVPAVFPKDHDGRVIALARWDCWGASIWASRSDEWYLKLEYPVRDPDTHRLVKVPLGEERPKQTSILRGEVAVRALSAVVPHANVTGGTSRAVQDALAVIASRPTLDRLIHDAGRKSHAITRMPAAYRLGLEMVLHEEDEHRAMEGELATLEERWREAEEIASIADSLL